MFSCLFEGKPPISKAPITITILDKTLHTPLLYMYSASIDKTLITCSSTSNGLQPPGGPYSIKMALLH